MSSCPNCCQKVYLTDPTLSCLKIHSRCLREVDDLLRIREMNPESVNILCKNCITDDNKLDTLLILINNLKADFQARLEKLEKQVSSGDAINISTSAAKEEIISETLDLMKRANNIIISGLAENNNDMATRDGTGIWNRYHSVTEQFGTVPQKRCSTPSLMATVKSMLKTVVPTVKVNYVQQLVNVEQKPKMLCNQEKREIILVYGESGRNLQLTTRVLQEHFPQVRYSLKKVRKIVRLFEDTS
ncbi:hypothetical protein TcasGA2_TC009409 [Tribolium castaneum]|uniref:DUF4817 domain-containing protein n=1 Tax=Tribolium castaneum TaxID=7070 RepID=D6WQU4_TRICA|nr:hypothetical protein TcasGA2_TC009409 [Tribolium castaneum]